MDRADPEVSIFLIIYLIKTPMNRVRMNDCYEFSVFLKYSGVVNFFYLLKKYPSDFFQKAFKIYGKLKGGNDSPYYMVRDDI